MRYTSYIIFCVFAFSCKPAGQNKLNDNCMGNMDIEHVSRALNTMVYTFPSSGELLSYFKEERFTFNPELANNPAHAKQYLTSKKQAYNIGIYITDLGYFSMLEGHRTSTRYIESILLLSDKLRIEFPRNHPTFMQIEKNRNNIDSLKLAIKQANSFMTNWLVDNNRVQIFAIVSVGAFIEFLHISLQQIGEYNADDPSIQQIANIKYSFENMRDFVSGLNTNYGFTCTNQEMDQLSKVFDSLEITKGTTQVDKKQNGKLVFSGGDKIKINEQQYNNLVNIVQELRTGIISTKS